MKYTDPDGEYVIVDDLIAMLVGGTINVISNASHITSIGHGIALFGVGATAGIVTIYASPIAGGAILGAGNSVINQGFTSNWNSVSIAQVAMDGVMGAGTAYLGGATSKIFASSLGNLASGIGNDVVRQAVYEAAMGGASGFTLGAGMALLNGSSFEDAMSQGGQGALMGITTGAISGTANGLKNSSKSAAQEREKSGIGKKIIENETDASFFEGTKYTDKVLDQIKRGDYHSFPESVKAFESDGIISTIKGGDGVTRQMLKIPGGYKGKTGFFEFIKESDGMINHRYFNPK